MLGCYLLRTEVFKYSCRNHTLRNLFFTVGTQRKPACVGFKNMGLHFHRFWDSARHMGETTIERLPSLLLSIAVFVLFYILSVVVSRFIRRVTRGRRENLGMVFARLMQAATILLGLLVAISVVAPSFQAADLIKILGIGGVAIGFAFQNILQNFLAGLLLLWAEPFRIGDEIKIDPYEGTVEAIQTRATIIKTYDERRVVVPNADLFTRAVIVNTATDVRRWEYDFSVKGIPDLEKLKSVIIDAVRNVPGVLLDPSPEVFVLELGDLDANQLKLRVLWWTKASRQHQMLASYDSVLGAIRQAIIRYTSEQKRQPQAPDRKPEQQRAA
jgi:small conductance mechanosensitive channel